MQKMYLQLKFMTGPFIRLFREEKYGRFFIPGGNEHNGSQRVLTSFVCQKLNESALVVS